MSDRRTQTFQELLEAFVSSGPDVICDVLHRHLAARDAQGPDAAGAVDLVDLVGPLASQMLRLGESPSGVVHRERAHAILFEWLTARVAWPSTVAVLPRNPAAARPVVGMLLARLAHLLENRRAGPASDLRGFLGALAAAHPAIDTASNLTAVLSFLDQQVSRAEPGPWSGPAGPLPLPSTALDSWPEPALWASARLHGRQRRSQLLLARLEKGDPPLLTARLAPSDLALKEELDGLRILVPDALLRRVTLVFDCRVGAGRASRVVERLKGRSACVALAADPMGFRVQVQGVNGHEAIALEGTGGGNELRLLRDALRDCAGRLDIAVLLTEHTAGDSRSRSGVAVPLVRMHFTVRGSMDLSGRVLRVLDTVAGPATSGDLAALLEALGTEDPFLAHAGSLRMDLLRRPGMAATGQLARNLERCLLVDLQRNPHGSMPLLGLARTALKASGRDAVVNLLEKAVRRGPPLVEALVDGARALSERGGDRRQSLDLTARAYHLNAEHPALRAWLGTLDAQAERYCLLAAVDTRWQ